MSNFKIALAGNPNVGKSTIFNYLTKSNQHTGNWSGKTVDNALGIMKYDSISEIINLLRFSGNLELIDFGGKDEFLKLMEKFETYHDIVCKYISNSEQMGQAELDLEVVEPLSSVAIDLYCLIDEFYKDSNSLVRK